MVQDYYHSTSPTKNSLITLSPDSDLKQAKYFVLNYYRTQLNNPNFGHIHPFFQPYFVYLLY